ncbi:MAG: hypothetical protein KA953_03375 [Lachnospiraceae bacterium]|nr:hypothetical protein [Lachnospiraceae bacterium]
MNSKKKNALFALFACVMIGVIVITVKVFFFPTKIEKKVFQEKDFSIQLTDEFKKKDLKGATYYYESDTAIVMIIRESEDGLEGIGVSSQSSLEEYMKAVVLNNELSKQTKIFKRGSYRFISYESGDKKTGEFSFIATTYKKDGQFWLVNFACRQSDDSKLKKEFLNWADSVKLK